MKSIATAFFLSAALAACTVSFSPSSQQNLPEPTSGTAVQQTEAATAARGYLSQIDSGDYDGTWNGAGPALKASSSKLMWTGMLKMSRKAFNSPKRRTIQGFGFTPQPDINAPVGEYVLVKIISKSGKAEVTEKVVMQKDAGKWKIVSYFINGRVIYRSNT